MMNFTSSLCLLCSLTCLFTLTFSQPAEAGWESMDTTQFSLPPAPRPGSPSELTDVQIILQLQNDRSPADCALASYQFSPGFEVFFGPKSGLLSKDEFQRVSPLFFRISKFTDKICKAEKDKYKRPRPYSSYPEINPCIKEPGGSKSYPSSHASLSRVEACVLAEVFPDRAAKVLALAERAGNLRVLAGVHYPQDVQAGKDLGQHVCEVLLANPDFQRDLSQLP